VTKLPEFFIDRVLSKEEADKIVGETVVAHDTNVNEAGSTAIVRLVRQSWFTHHTQLRSQRCGKQS